MTLSCLNCVMFVRKLSVAFCHLKDVSVLFLCLEALLIKVSRRDKKELFLSKIRVRRI